jgi:tRNA dimethylallyltransferase
VTEAILIAGPTASGKSAAALALARTVPGLVINADAMQVYRELAVLTARPPTAAMVMVPHRLYGTVPAAEPYSVSRWLADAAAAIEEARREGRVPILVGGTGLYFKTLLEGLSPVPEIPAEIRARWRERGESLDARALYDELLVRDPIMAARLEPTDAQRLLRALEVIDATGVSLSDWQGIPGSPLLPADKVLRLVVAPEREVIYEAIDRRFERMMEEGALDEVNALRARGLDPSRPVMRTLGVRELCAHLDGDMTLNEALTKAKTESRRYAKRQMTWLKRFMADWEWAPTPQAMVELAKRAPL